VRWCCVCVCRYDSWAVKWCSVHYDDVQTWTSRARRQVLRRQVPQQGTNDQNCLLFVIVLLTLQCHGSIRLESILSCWKANPRHGMLRLSLPRCDCIYWWLEIMIMYRVGGSRETDTTVLKLQIFTLCLLHKIITLVFHARLALVTNQLIWYWLRWCGGTVGNLTEKQKVPKQVQVKWTLSKVANLSPAFPLSKWCCHR